MEVEAPPDPSLAARPTALPLCMGWNAPRGSGQALLIPAEKRAAAFQLASTVALAPANTPINMAALSAQLGEAWEQGAEAIVDYLAQNGLAEQTGDGDSETVAFLVLPNSEHI